MDSGVAAVAPGERHLELSEFSCKNPVFVLFWREALARGLLQTAYRKKASPRRFDAALVEEMGGPGSLVGGHSRYYRQEVFRYADDCVVHMQGPLHEIAESSETGEFEWTVASTDRVRSDRVADDIGALLPAVQTSEDVVPMVFWTLGSNGSIRTVRQITAPAWDEIEANYSAGTRNALAELAALRPPFDGGKLLILRGEPGTGQTYAIRALSREWHEWCRMHYIVDPDHFFGRAHYMLDILLDHDEARKWNLLVIEDADEFLTVDAKSRATTSGGTGQSFARLLNLTEGLIGQGLRILLMITTNEPIGKLHPAIARPGRCMANIEFGSLSHAEADAWLARHGVENVSVASATLAQLYKEVRGRTAIWAGRPRRMGFALEGAS